MKKAVIFLGPPGSGKGTQASLVSEKANLQHLSTGDLLRKEISSGSELGLKIDSIISKGNLLDDNLTGEILDNNIDTTGKYDGILFDGYPRTFNQVSILDKIISNHSLESTYVIEIKVPEELLVKRITGRFSCNNCGSIYNKFFNAPKQENICDTCGESNFSSRSDDNEEVLKDRINIYNTNVSSIIDSYKSKGIYYTVDGSKDSKELSKEIIDILV